MVFCLALKYDKVEQCLGSSGSEFQMWGPKQENVSQDLRHCSTLSFFKP